MARFTTIWAKDDAPANQTAQSRCQHNLEQLVDSAIDGGKTGTSGASEHNGSVRLTCFILLKKINKFSLADAVGGTPTDTSVWLEYNRQLTSDYILDIAIASPWRGSLGSLHVKNI